MPMHFMKATEQQHLAKAQKNRQLSTALETQLTDYRDWQVITVFYAAVHLVQAYLRAKTSAYPQTHQERDELINRLPDLKPLYVPYNELKRVSVKSRYACLPVNQYDVNEARKQYDIIRAHIDKLLAPPALPTPQAPVAPPSKGAHPTSDA
jgi:HEPN domain-containing protein